MASRTEHQIKKAGDDIADQLITAEIKDALVRDLHLAAHEMHIATLKGKVRLTGFVSSYSHIDQTVALASRVAGVKAVCSVMQLK